MWYLIVSIPDLCTITYFYYDWAQGERCQNAKNIFYNNLLGTNFYKPVGKYYFTMTCIRALVKIENQVINRFNFQPKHMFLEPSE